MKKRLSLFLALLLVATTIFGAIPTFAADAGAELSAADQAAVVTRILEGIYESEKTGKPYYFD